MGSKALVMGARSGSGNIGDGIRAAMTNTGWTVMCHDAWLDGKGRYGVPDLPGDSEESAYAKCDALIISLGKESMDDFDKVHPSAIEEVINACLVLPLQIASRYVQDRGERGGKIIMIGSYGHRHPFTSGTAYCAAKAGLDMAGRTMGWELSEKGFYTHVVHPYHVPGTDMWNRVQRGVMVNKGMEREEADAYAQKDVKMRLMEPIEIGRVVRMLCEFTEADWLSGSSLELYGGTR